MIHFKDIRDRVVASWRTTLVGLLLFAGWLTCALVPAIPFGWLESLPALLIAVWLVGMKTQTAKPPAPSPNGQAKKSKRPSGGAGLAAALLVIGGIATGCCSYEKCVQKYATDTTHVVVVDTIDTVLTVTVPPATVVFPVNIDSLLLMSTNDTLTKSDDRAAVDLWKDPTNNTMYVRSRVLPVPFPVRVSIPTQTECPPTTQFAPPPEQDGFWPTLYKYGFWSLIIIIALVLALRALVNRLANHL